VRDRDDGDQPNDLGARSNPSDSDEDGLIELIDLGLIHKALAEAGEEASADERARAVVAALSAMLLMHGQLELGNGLGALIGLKPLDAEVLKRLATTTDDESDG
jgi:hypothetical protein